MPREGSVVLGDLAERSLERLQVDCERCHRRGGYSVEALIASRGAEAKLTDLLVDLAEDCLKRTPQSYLDRCGAHFSQL